MTVSVVAITDPDADVLADPQALATLQLATTEDDIRRSARAILAQVGIAARASA